MQETTPKLQLLDPNLVAIRHQASLKGHAAALRALHAETLAAAAATTNACIAEALRDEANKLMASHAMLLRQAQLVANSIDNPLAHSDRSHPPPASMTAAANCPEGIS